MYSPLAIKWNSIFKVWLRKSFNFFPFYRISIFGAQTQNVSRRFSIFGSVSFLLHSIDSPNSSNLKIQSLKILNSWKCDFRKEARWESERLGNSLPTTRKHQASVGVVQRVSNLTNLDFNNFQILKFENLQLSNFLEPDGRMKARTFPFSRVLEKARLSFHFTEFPFFQEKVKTKKTLNFSILPNFHFIERGLYFLWSDE